MKFSFLLNMPKCYDKLLASPLFYIITKEIFSSLLSYHLFWYSCSIPVRIQQNMRKVQKITIGFSILRMWLADSTLEARNSNQDHPSGWPWSAPVAWCPLYGMGLFFIPANYSLVAKPIIQWNAFSHFSLLQLCIHVIYCWILTGIEH